jgi:phospholipid/cholesterol/gamma-HCH transport system substrate-binding protein
MTPMRVLWQRVRTEPQLGRNVIALATVILLGLGAGGYIVGRQGAGVLAWPWEDRLHFTAQFREAPAIAPGQGHEVRIAGVPVGAIEDATVTEDGLAEVELSVEPEHTIYHNARLVLRPKSPLNEMYVTIDPGGPPAKPLADGDTLPAANTVRPIQVDEVLSYLDNDTRDALSALITESDLALARAPKELAPGLNSMDALMQQMQPVMSALRTRQEALAELITALSTMSDTIGGNDQRLITLATTLEQTLHDLGAHSRPLDESLRQLPGFMDQLEQTMGRMSELSSELDPTLANLSRAGDPLADGLEDLDPVLDRATGFFHKAGPLAAEARPVFRNLRPALAHVRPSMPDLNQMTAQLDPFTGGLVQYQEDVSAYVYNTASVVSIRDETGPIVRAMTQIDPASIPLLQDLAASSKQSRQGTP